MLKNTNFYQVITIWSKLNHFRGEKVWDTMMNTCLKSGRNNSPLGLKKIWTSLFVRMNTSNSTAALISFQKVGWLCKRVLNILILPTWFAKNRSALCKLVSLASEPENQNEAQKKNQKEAQKKNQLQS